MDINIMWIASGILSSDSVANVLIAGVTLAENHIGISLNYFRDAEDAFVGVIASTIIGSLNQGGCTDGADSSWAQVCHVKSMHIIYPCEMQL